jgi:hypothetical protein
VKNFGAILIRGKIPTLKSLFISSKMAEEISYDIIFHKIATDKVKKLGNGSWLELQEIEYIDPNTKVIRKWELCKRKNCMTESKKNVDGKIMAKFLYKLTY